MNIGNILATKGDKVYTIKPEQSLKEAIDLLTQLNIGALVVVDSANKPIGILSERDIIHYASRDGAAIFAHKIVDCMTKNVVKATPRDDVQAVLKTMTDRHFRHMPIVDEHGELAGMISIGDVVKAQLNEYRGTIDNLQSQL